MPRPNPALIAQMRDMGSNVPVALTPDYFFDYIAEFANINAGQTVNIPVRIDSNVFFIAEMLNSSFQLNGAFGAAIDGSPLARDGNGLIANNTMPTMAHLRCAITTTDRPWTNLSTGVRMDLLTGTGQNGGWVPFKQSVAGGDVINVAVTNDGPTPVKGQVCFRGHKLPLQTN